MGIGVLRFFYMGTEVFSVRNRILIYGHWGFQIWRRLRRWLRPVHMPVRFVGSFVLFAWPWHWGGIWRLRFSLHSWLLSLCQVLRFTVGCPLIFLRYALEWCQFGSIAMLYKPTVLTNVFYLPMWHTLYCSSEVQFQLPKFSMILFCICQ